MGHSSKNNNWYSSNIFHDGPKDNRTDCINYAKTDHDVSNQMDSQGTGHISLKEIGKKLGNMLGILLRIHKIVQQFEKI